jgi:hypothetical protein
VTAARKPGPVASLQISSGPLYSSSDPRLYAAQQQQQQQRQQEQHKQHLQQQLLHQQQHPHQPVGKRVFGPQLQPAMQAQRFPPLEVKPSQPGAQQLHLCLLWTLHKLQVRT